MRHPFGAALAVVSLLAYCGAAAADFKAGVAAYKASDYATAHKEFMALAERGMAAAQSNLGLMYSRGQGVPQDNPTAAYWYRMAADQGLAVAQHNLGILYKKGDGVPKDDVLALMWLYIAEESGYLGAKKSIGTLEKQASKDQIDLAQRLKELWTEKLEGGGGVGAGPGPLAVALGGFQGHDHPHKVG